jgi:hypothetical protein
MLDRAAEDLLAAAEGIAVRRVEEIDAAFESPLNKGMVARGAAIGTGAAADIEIPLAGLTIEAFTDALAPLRAEVAGVPVALERFRDGDESLIAFDRLSAPAGADPDALFAVQIARNVFLDSLTETTKYLQDAVRRALDATRAERHVIRTFVEKFESEFGKAALRAYPCCSRDGC